MHVAECLLLFFLQGLVVELLLALLHGPLKCPGENWDVVVALQAIALCANVDGKLGL